MMTIPFLIFGNSDAFKKPARIFNALVLINFIPLMVAGGMCVRPVVTGFFEGEYRLGSLWTIVGWILALVTGGTMHEFAHAAACISYGGKVTEIGLLLGSQSGAYTMMDHFPIRYRLRRVQAFAAGIEINAELAMLSLILCRILPGWAPFLLEFAFINADFAMVNLLFIEGLDGMAIMEALLGDDCLLDNATKVMFNARRGRRLRRYGINGRASVTAAYLIGATKLFWPVVIGLNIVIILGVFL